MQGLLYKEFYENRRSLKLFAAFAFYGFFIMLSRVFFMFKVNEQLEVLTAFATPLVLMLMTGIINTTIFRYDEKKLWSGFVSSTPVAAKGQVKSKYLFALLLYMITLSACFIADTLNCALHGAAPVFETVALVFWVQLIFSALEFPFVIRFGSKKGNNIRAVIVIALLFIVIVYALFGDISMFITEESFYDFATRLLKGEIGAMEMLWVNAVIPYVAITLYILSYKLSCKFYQKGAESFEN